MVLWCCYDDGPGGERRGARGLEDDVAGGVIRCKVLGFLDHDRMLRSVFSEMNL